MKHKLPYLILAILLLTAAGCATMGQNQFSLQEWRRSYIPARQG